ncbi:MAG: dienelactone hydrolase family protein [Myxococcota bacterium]|nr:dienelactone hydrolase family protein [Myxococcota bacterium]MDW8362477.1 phospholipase [Myxococcales bacterium]
MRTESFGPLRVHLTGGTDREGGGSGPLVVLLHGFGAPGTDLVGLWRVLRAPRGVRFAFPEAPIDLGPAYAGGRAWWRIDVAALERALQRGELRDLSRSEPEGLAEARRALIAALDAMLAALQVPVGRLVLGGFSQGAMLSLDVALRTAIPMAGLCLMSGTFLCEHEWRPRMPARAGLPVVLSHGRQDPLLPFALAERLRDALHDAGLDVRFVPFHGVHEIPPIVLDEVGRLLEGVLG